MTKGIRSGWTSYQPAEPKPKTETPPAYSNVAYTPTITWSSPTWSATTNSTHYAIDLNGAVTTVVTTGNA